MRKLTIILLTGATLFATSVNRIRFGSPVEVGSDNSSPSFTVVSLNATTNFLAWVFPAPASETLTTFLFRQAIGTTGTQPQYRVSLQTVDGSGQPTGTILAAGSYTSAGSGANSLIQSVSTLFDASGTSLPSGIALTRGTYYAMVIDPCPNATAPCSGAATPDTLNFTAFSSVVTGMNMGTTSGMSTYSLTTTNSGTAWTKGLNQPLYGYRTASTTRGFPMQTLQTTSINQGAESGMLFNLPATFCSTAQVAGVYFLAASPIANKTLHLSLYSGTTVLQSAVIDGDYAKAAGTLLVYTWYFTDATLATLSCGTTYRVGIAPAGGGSEAFGLKALNFPTAGDRLAFPGGDWFAYTSRTGCTAGAACDTTSTAFTDDTTTRPMMHLIFDDITQPSGSGGTRSYAGQ
jgi:hypothetical protein